MVQTGSGLRVSMEDDGGYADREKYLTQYLHMEAAIKQCGGQLTKDRLHRQNRVLAEWPEA